MAVEVSATMEKLTVHSTSYRPVPLSTGHRHHRHQRRSAVAKLSGHVALETDTVHRNAYRPKDPQRSLKSTPPLDHAFLAGDGRDRFSRTVYKSDYQAKIGLPGKSSNSTSVRNSLSHVPIQSETTTGSAYPRSIIPEIWYRPISVYQVSTRPFEKVSVHRASYKPFKPEVYQAENKTNACISRSVTDYLYRTTVPVESSTTYTTFYGYSDSLEKIPNRFRGPIDEAPRAHEYELLTNTTCNTCKKVCNRT